MQIPSLRDYFLLDPEVIYLNHGSFGATPSPVFSAYQEFQRELERQPVRFFNTGLMDELASARQALAAYLNSDADNLVFIPNATHAINLIARSLPFRPGDEILASDHEYGAFDNVWQFISQKTGAVYVRQSVPITAKSAGETVECLWQGVTPRTKIIFISHIASPTAFHFPVKDICLRARQAGILTFVDGAHAPGQIPVNLDAIAADFYTGNCHKWMLAPKGAAFLYTRQEHQSMIEPLVISWGWGENSPFDLPSKYLGNLQWSGTNDYSAYLSVPSAIQFQDDHEWDAVRQSCCSLLFWALYRISEITGLAPIHSEIPGSFRQMGIASLPPIDQPEKFKNLLYDQFRIEIPIIEWNNHHFLRISMQGYNTQEELESLLTALKVLLPAAMKSI
jgi:isopenicillin-N epimerase